MAAASTTRRASGMGLLLGQMWAWLKTMGMGAALGATLGVGVLRLAPQASAEAAGPLACPGQAATVAEVQALEIKDWNQAVWVLATPQLRCASTQGTQAAAPGFAALWYGTFAAGGAGLASLAYLAWAIIHYTAPAPAPKAARVARAKQAAKAAAEEEAEADEPEADYPAQFLKECCEVGRGQRMTAAELNAAYTAWARAKGQRPPATKTLARDWRRLGLKPRGWGQPKAWRGARLKETA